MSQRDRSDLIFFLGVSVLMLSASLAVWLIRPSEWPVALACLLLSGVNSVIFFLQRKTDRDLTA